MDFITAAAIYHRPAANGDEQDAFSPAARRALAGLRRPGVTARTKSRAARRDRHQVARQLRALAG